uniref:Uncharacterized protein n=1 Tax=Arundo donax TaxID=35708 RepID=A0A0A9AFE6_ARUDO
MCCISSNFLASFGQRSLLFVTKFMLCYCITFSNCKMGP